MPNSGMWLILLSPFVLALVLALVASPAAARSAQPTAGTPGRIRGPRRLWALVLAAGTQLAAARVDFGAHEPSALRLLTVLGLAAGAVFVVANLPVVAGLARIALIIAACGGLLNAAPKVVRGAMPYHRGSAVSAGLGEAQLAVHHPGHVDLDQVGSGWLLLSDFIPVPCSGWSSASATCSCCSACVCS